MVRLFVGLESLDQTGFAVQTQGILCHDFRVTADEARLIGVRCVCAVAELVRVASTSIRSRVGIQLNSAAHISRLMSPRGEVLLLEVTFRVDSRTVTAIDHTVKLAARNAAGIAETAHAIDTERRVASTLATQTSRTSIARILGTRTPRSEVRLLTRASLMSKLSVVIANFVVSGAVLAFQGACFVGLRGVVRIDGRVAFRSGGSARSN